VSQKRPFLGQPGSDAPPCGVVDPRLAQGSFDPLQGCKASTGVYFGSLFPTHHKKELFMQPNIVGIDRPDLVFLMGAIASWALSMFLFRSSCDYSIFVLRSMLSENFQKLYSEDKREKEEKGSPAILAEQVIDESRDSGYLYYLIKDKFHVDPLAGSLLIHALPGALFLFVPLYLFFLNYDESAGLDNEQKRALLIAIGHGLLFHPAIISAVMLFSSFVNVAMAMYKFLTMSALYKTSGSTENRLHPIPRASLSGIAGAIFSMIGLIGSLASIYGLALYLSE
jgi:hypothetical protein